MVRVAGLEGRIKSLEETYGAQEIEKYISKLAGVVRQVQKDEHKCRLLRFYAFKATEGMDDYPSP